MNLNERLIQCRKDKEAIEAEEKELLEQMKPKKLVFGDVVSCAFGVRIMFYNKNGVLMAFDNRGYEIGSNDPNFYKKEYNMFDENCLVLNN